MYSSLGKQVLSGTDHVADAVSPYMAQQIAEALNMADPSLDYVMLQTNWPNPPTMVEFVPMTDMPDRISGHTIRRESDEYVCNTCGVRWGCDEGDDHP